MPPYPGVSQVMEVTDLARKQGELAGTTTSTSVGWEAEYAAYLEEKNAAQEQATDATSLPPPTKDEEKESWEAQYAAHCAEKEARLADEDARRIQAMKD
jgi:hypothetical protein